MRELIPKVRSQLTAVNADFSSKLRELYDQVQDCLLDALCKPQETGFMRLLSAYEERGLEPGKAEITALVTLNGGNLVGFRLINNLLELVESKYRIQCPEVETLEKTLEDLQHLAEELELMPMFGLAHFTEGKQVFGLYGKKTTVNETHNFSITSISMPAYKLSRAKDGSVITTGERWDDVGLTICASTFEELPNRINAMSEPWTSIVTYPEIITDETITGIQLATEIGQEKAKSGGAVKSKLADTGIVK